MPAKNRYTEVGIYNFSTYTQIVFLFVLILSTFTSGGLFAIVFPIYGVPISIGLFLVLFVVTYRLKHMLGRSRVTIDKYWVYLMLFIQSLLILFNFGTCVSGEGNFIQRMIYSTKCWNGDLIAWIPQEIILGIYALNLSLLAIFIIRTLASAHSKSN